MPEPTTQQEREAPCMECGMICNAGEFHPFDACVLFKTYRDGNLVRAALKWIADEYPRSLPPTDTLRGLLESVLRHHDCADDLPQNLVAQIRQAVEGNADDVDDFTSFLDNSGPPLIGRWHHGNGVLVSGSIRIAQWDCDTNPPAEFRDKVLDWVCESLNAALAQQEGAGK